MMVVVRMELVRFGYVIMNFALCPGKVLWNVAGAIIRNRFETCFFWGRFAKVVLVQLRFWMAGLVCD